MKNDRFKYRLVFKKTYRTINGNFDGYEIYYCNGFIKTKNKIEFKSKNKRYNFYSCSLKSIDQCIGLKDSKNNLIYEKDIVKFYFDKDEIIAIIEWDNNESCFYLNTTDYFKDKYITDYEITKQEKYEVIGNIYENKKLLQERTVQN